MGRWWGWGKGVDYYRRSRFKRRGRKGELEEKYICIKVLLAFFRAQELCVKVEVAALGSPSVIVLNVSVDVKQHWI